MSSTPAPSESPTTTAPPSASPPRPGRRRAGSAAALPLLDRTSTSTALRAARGRGLARRPARGPRRCRQAARSASSRPGTGASSPPSPRCRSTPRPPRRRCALGRSRCPSLPLPEPGSTWLWSEIAAGHLINLQGLESGHPAGGGEVWNVGNLAQQTRAAFAAAPVPRRRAQHRRAGAPAIRGPAPVAARPGPLRRRSRQPHRSRPSPRRRRRAPGPSRRTAGSPGSCSPPGTRPRSWPTPPWATQPSTTPSPKVRALELQDAVAYALRARGERKRPTSGWDSLTPTELQVVEQVAAGQTNTEIADVLLMGRTTVKTHLAHIFTKLDFTNRAELAAQATRRASSTARCRRSRAAPASVSRPPPSIPTPVPPCTDDDAPDPRVPSRPRHRLSSPDRG